MISRRSFLESLSAAAGGLALARAAGADTRAGAAEAGDPGRLERIGVQLYTVRRAMEKNVEQTLDRVAAIGYTEVEFAGYFGRKPAQVRAALRHAGLRAPSAHVSYGDLGNGWPRQLEEAHAIGHEWIVCAWIDANERRTVADYQRICAKMNAAAAAARKAGLRFAVHNHDYEFTPVEGKVPYDILQAETDRKLVEFEMDLYWITRGRHDPLTYFAQYPGRFPLVHVKDMKQPPTGAMVDVGAGEIDFRRILADGKRAGIKHWFVEHDEPPDPFASIANSYKYLRALTF
jgi:sugar phosphate isomerase/epimerase